MRVRKRIVALGLYIPGIGFTRVFDALFAHLGKVFDIHWIGIAYKGPVLHTPAYTLYPNNLEGGDMYGTYGSHHLAKKIEADFVLFIQDAWMLHNYRRMHAEQPWKTIGYVPLDGDITDPADVVELSWLDHVVAYHGDAAVQFRMALQALHTQQKINAIPAIHHIYHGVDPERFVRSEDHAEIRKKLFGHIRGWQSTCFFLNANRFAERKDIYTTLQGFAMARASTRKNIMLCLHMPSIEQGQQQTLFQWLDELGLQESVIFNPLRRSGYSDDDALVELYQACDVGINTSFGEGWGLIAFEHAACGGAQILPAQRGQREIWKEAAAFIDLIEPVKLPSNPFLMHRASALHLAQLIVRLSGDQNALDELQQRGHDHATSSAFQWQGIAQQWERLFEQTLANKPTEH